MNHLDSIRHVAESPNFPALRVSLNRDECTDLLGALERARVVAVLDGWQRANPGWAVYVQGDSTQWWCGSEFNHPGYEPLFDARFELFGETPDAARAAAARAIEAGEV